MKDQEKAAWALRPDFGPASPIVSGAQPLDVYLCSSHYLDRRRHANVPASLETSTLAHPALPPTPLGQRLPPQRQGQDPVGGEWWG